MSDDFTPVFGDRRGTAGYVDSSGSPILLNERNPNRGSTSLMLDPSVFFRPHDDVVASVKEIRENLGVSRIVTPAGFMAIIETDDHVDSLPALGSPAGRRSYGAGHVRELIRAAGVTAFRVPTGMTDDHYLMRTRLHEVIRDPVIASIRFDEWFYLTHNSTLVSRIKRPFSQLAQGGAVVVELLTPLGAKIVRRTLKLDDLETVTRARALRALGKWVAVGGSSALPFVGPWAAAVGALASGSFLLVDP